MTIPWWELPADLAVFAILFSFYFYVTRRVRRQNLAAIRAATVTVRVTVPSVTYACQHMAIVGVTSAACGLCGPLARVA